LCTGELSKGESDRSSEPCGGEKPVDFEFIATIFRLITCVLSNW
jgi:hypothetical protein